MAYRILDSQEIYDDNDNFVGFLLPSGEQQFVPRWEGLSEGVTVVVSASAPSDGDGRPNGTIYIQTA